MSSGLNNLSNNFSFFSFYLRLCCLSSFLGLDGLGRLGLGPAEDLGDARVEHLVGAIRHQPDARQQTQRNQHDHREEVHQVDDGSPLHDGHDTDDSDQELRPGRHLGTLLLFGHD